MSPRYLLFAGVGFYSDGGADDLIGTYDDLGTALEHVPVKGSTGDWTATWAHVLEVGPTGDAQIVADYSNRDDFGFGERHTYGNWELR